MGQRENLPHEDSPQNSQAADVILRNLTQDLQALQRNVSGQLAQDIAHLQGQKQRLMEDILALEGDYDELRSQYQALQNSHETALSQQQQIQQQLWAKRLAQALATHLHARLADTLTTSLGASAGVSGQSNLPQTQHVLSSLDSTLHSTLQSLQQDLNSYQSSLSQQIGRMHSLEQQGEAILDALVNRLSQKLQSQLVGVQSPAVWQNGHSRVDLPAGGRPLPYSGQPGLTSTNGHTTGAGYGFLSPTATESPSPHRRSTPPHPVTVAAGLPKQRDSFQRGLLFVICATLALSIHNVIVGIIGYGGALFGQIPINGIFPLNIPNSLMLLWLRMVVVVPLTALAANRLYPNLWEDIRQLFSRPNRRPLAQVMASGAFLFMSQVLIYKAISDIGPGVAVTLLFMYPLIVVPLGWFLLGKRSTTLQFVVMSAITMGIVFTALPRISVDLARGEVSAWGIGAALLSSAAFALYLIAMDLSFRQELHSNQKLHPAPVSLIQFATIFVLTSVTLIVGSFFGLQPEQPSSPIGLYLGGLLLGILTLLGYLFNNYAVRCMGSSQTAIVAASGPAVTALMAYLLTPGEKSTLQFIQWIGVILVTLGVVSLSQERLAREQREKKTQPIRTSVP